MSEQGRHASTPRRAGMLARLAAAGVVAMAFGLPWQAAQAATGGEVSLVSCAPDTFNCTANDAQGAINVTAADIPSCTVGEWVDVPVTIAATTSGNNQRLDIGAWFDSQTPGQCQNAMTTATDNVAGKFINLDGDTCGDKSGGGTATETFTIQVQCNPDADGKITFPTLAYWSNHHDPNICNPFPATKSKCVRGTTTVNVSAIKGKITVKKIAADAGEQTFGFGVTGGATQNFELAAGGTQIIEVDATKADVSYTITETVPDGWQFSGATCTSTNGGTWSNTAGSSAVTVQVSFAHTDISCEFTNAKIPPSGTVTLMKSLTVGDPGQFTYTLGNQTTAASGGSGEKVSGTFTAGSTVSFSEAAATGTSLDNYDIGWRCVRSDDQQLITAGTGSSGSFTMPNVGAVCTITNERRMYELRVRKLLSPTTDTGKFNLLINGTGESNVGHDGVYFVNVPMGSEVTVSETAGANTLLANYSSQLVCEWQIIVQAAVRENRQATPPYDPVPGTSATFTMPGSNLSCTFANTRLSATLKVAKAWGTGFTAGDKATVTTTGFVNNASSGESTAGTGTTGTAVTVYAGETGQLTETFSVGNMSDYTQSYACSGGGTVDADGAVSIAAADKDKDITCTLTNTRRPTGLSVSKTSSVSGALEPGGSVTYTVEVRNTGQAALKDVPVSDPMPSGIDSQTWNCTGYAGATCDDGSGAGGIDSTVDLPAGAWVIYTINATVATTDLPAQVTNRATVTPPTGTPCTGNVDGSDACEATVSNPPKPPTPPPAAVTPVPTTSPEGLAALALMVLGAAGWATRRQRRRGRK